MFKAVLFLIDKSWKKSKYPQNEVGQTVADNIMKYFSAINRNKLLIYATIKMNC